MAAAYDTYDYPSYWEGREYEHESEVIAIREFLAKIPKIGTILDIGAGYGRLTPAYYFRAKKVILTDPSRKLLKIAKENFGDKKNVVITRKAFSDLKENVRPKSVSLALMVRVLHHLVSPDDAFSEVARVLKKGGYFILEVANKGHFKALFKEFMRGNFTYVLDIFPKDIRSEKAVRQKAIPFINYHPEVIKHKLEEAGFKIVDVLSVSNIRSRFIKKLLTHDTLLTLEKLMQKPLSYINFGPSIFILAQRI